MVLDLTLNKIGGEGAQHFALALEVNTVRLDTSIPSLLCYTHFIQTLRELHLGANKIGTEGTKYLASALQGNMVKPNFSTFCYPLPLYLTQTLSILSLCSNDMYAEEIKHLAYALTMNTVTFAFSISKHSSAIFILHRHSQRFILYGTILALKEHSIWQTHYK